MNKDSKEEEAHLHWADVIAAEVIKRAESEEVLRKIVKEKGFIVYDEKTPSGKIHIGSGRGWVIHDVIAKSLRSMGVRGRFILSSDDIDPFDKMNVDLPKSYEKYLGMPFRNIPSPVKGYESFADYYFREATNKFEEFGIEAELESTGERYEKGDFDWAIKKVLDNSEKISKIYERFYGKPLGKLPFNPICERCGKIGTTRAYEWDPHTETVSYVCEEKLVSWARGCGYKGERSPYKGGGKFPWKVEWAAKWPVVGVVCEYAGKDHFTKGGSRDIAVAICNEVFDFPPPYPSTRHSSGKGYEFFTIGGKKMSTSKGRGMGFAESTEYAPAEILRYLLVATRPRAVIDFDPVNRNDLILLYERYDRTERIYFGAEEGVSEKERMKHSRLYELSHIGPVPKKMPPQVSFLNAAIIVQAAAGSVERAITLLKKNRMVPERLDKSDELYVTKRLTFAKNWVERFAPEQFRFRVQEEPTRANLEENEKNALRELAERLKKEEDDEKSLYEEIYNIARRNSVEPKDFFRVAYKVLINKERGPRLAPFIIAVGKERVAEILEKATSQGDSEK